jgi:methionine synthase I (cobalamin-dependent)
MKILERLNTEILTGDGAVGTMLYTKGVSLESNFEHLNWRGNMPPPEPR